MATGQSPSSISHTLVPVEFLTRSHHPPDSAASTCVCPLKGLISPDSYGQCGSLIRPASNNSHSGNAPETGRLADP
jgi:hypothetical protein